MKVCATICANLAFLGLASAFISPSSSPPLLVRERSRVVAWDMRPEWKKKEALKPSGGPKVAGATQPVVFSVRRLLSWRILRTKAQSVGCKLGRGPRPKRRCSHLITTLTPAASSPRFIQVLGDDFTKETMAVPGMPLSEVAAQADVFIKYKCRKVHT